MNMSQILDFLGSKAGVQILELFIKYPEREMYQAEIINEIKITANPKLSFFTAKKWLTFFVKNGLIFERKKGKLIQYVLDRGNPVIKQFKIFINVAKILESLKDMPIDDAEAYLFGSCARGEDDGDSDIDLLLIGEINNLRLVKIKSAIMDKMSREVNLVHYSRMQYSDLYRDNKPFYENIERDKIRLL